MTTINITRNDHAKLAKLLEEKRHHDAYDTTLLAELTRARIIEPHEAPRDIVTMNSLISVTDLATDARREYWLVFPEAADVASGKISVLSPIGCALLGARVHDVVIAPAPAGSRRLRIESVLYQPESMGAYD